MKILHHFLHENLTPFPPEDHVPIPEWTFSTISCMKIPHHLLHKNSSSFPIWKSCTISNTKIPHYILHENPAPFVTLKSCTISCMKIPHQGLFVLCELWLGLGDWDSYSFLETILQFSITLCSTWPFYWSVFLDGFSLITNIVLVLQNVHTLEFLILHVSHYGDILQSSLKASLWIVLMNLITSKQSGLWAKLFVVHNIATLFVIHNVIHNVHNVIHNILH